MLNKNSNKCIIMHFPSYSGGKFIQNCLALSKECALLSLNTVDQLTVEPDNYKYRLDCVLSTLPKRGNMKNWVSDYEFGDYEFYGDAFINWQEGLDALVSEKVQKVFDADLHFFITAHSLDIVSKLISVWNNATIVSLINYEQFQIKAHKLKSTTRIIDNANESASKYNQLKGSDWPLWVEFQENAYNIDLFDNINNNIQNEIKEFYPTFKNKHFVFNVDKCFLNNERFISEMKQLYTNLNFGDFNEEFITSYWNRYIELHD